MECQDLQSSDFTEDLSTLVPRSSRHKENLLDSLLDKGVEKVDGLRPPERSEVREEGSDVEEGLRLED